MGRLDGDMANFTIGRGGFAFTGARFDKLAGTATDFTLVTIAVDVSTSVGPYKSDLISMLKTSVEACKKNPRSENILVRVILFSDRFDKGTSEMHGFKPLADINADDYNSIKTGGMTPLNDAGFSAVGATNKYAEEMRKRDFGSNAIFFIITDGGENASVSTMDMLKKEVAKALQSEQLESLISILIGVNSDQYDDELQEFQAKAGLTHYKKAGDATPRNLAKLAEFVSQSVSSQSQALGTGGPSQNIAATI